MMRPARRFGVVCLLLAGMVLRALVPAGYMPADPASGLLFELCPGQLPAGLSMPGATHGHQHHQHGAEQESRLDPDRCPVGHLLASAVALDAGWLEVALQYRPVEPAAPRGAARHYKSSAAYLSRAPPA